MDESFIDNMEEVQRITLPQSCRLSENLSQSIAQCFVRTFDEPYGFDMHASPFSLKSLFVAIVSMVFATQQFVVSAQGVEWVNQMEGVGETPANNSYFNNPSGISHVVDDSGNVYMVGAFYDTIDCDPGIGEVLFNVGGATGRSFVIKLDSNGDFIWARQITANSDFNQLLDVTLDMDGNLILGGRFEGSADFDPGPGSLVLTSEGEIDGFIAKWTSGGSMVWTRQFEGASSSSSSSVYKVAVGNTNEIILIGSFRYGVDFDPGVGTFSINGGVFSDQFIMNMSSNGELIDVFNISTGTATSVITEDLVIDDSMNVYILGRFSGTTDFNPNGTTLMTPLGGGFDVYIAKYDSTESLVWVYRMGNSTSQESGMGIELDTANNIIISGRYGGTIDVDVTFLTSTLTTSGGNNGYVCKYDNSMNLIWKRKFQASAASDVQIQSMDIDKYNNLYFCGRFIGTIDMDPSSNNANVSASNLAGAGFITRLDAAGNYQAAYKFGGDTLGTTLLQVQVDTNLNVHSYGNFTGDGDFDPSNDTILLSPVGDMDDVILKLGQCLVTDDTALSGCDSVVALSGTYTWTQSGTYTDFSFGGQDCDTIRNTLVDIEYSSFDSITAFGCYAYTSPSGNYTWNQTGVYLDTIINAAGCDSVMAITVDLGVDSTSIQADACDSYTSPSGNNVWTVNGIYTDTLLNSNGCDSILTIDLSIWTETYGSLFVSVCDSFVAPSGNQVFYQSAAFTDTISNIHGCDSIISIDLNIGNESMTDVQTACEEYFWVASNQLLLLSGTYIDTFINSSGCDSIVTLDLTIVDTVDVGVLPSINYLSALAQNAGYQWMVCDSVLTPISGAVGQDYYPSQNGSFAVEVSKYGCIDTSDCYSIVLVYGIRSLNGIDVRIFPNPVQDLLNIQQLDGGSSTIELSLYDPTGRLVLQTECSEESSVVDVSELSSGMYQCVLIDANGHGTSLSIIKQ